MPDQILSSSFHLLENISLTSSNLSRSSPFEISFEALHKTLLDKPMSE